jgi:hypothetical protein
VSSPRDEIDDWLGGDVEPLSPPPGALDRIRRRARRRKVNQAMVAAAGCAVVLAAAVAVPQLVGGSNHPGKPVAGGATPPSVRPSASQATSNRVAPSVHSSAPIQRPPQRTTLSNSWTVPPPGFRPTSVTFVGTGSDTVVGAVIGQAARPCASQFCTSLAGTSNYGSSWYGVSAPYAPGPDGSTGVSQLRFASLSDGWAFGPGLYETKSGGSSWHQEPTGGQRVIDIEAAAGGPALGLFATCVGTGPAYAADCASFSLNTSVAGTRTWTPVTVPAGTMSTPGIASSADLVVTGGTGYLLTPTGALLTGPVSGGTWRLAGHAPCTPGAAQTSGLPTQALLVTSPQQLMLACTTGSTGGPSSSGPLVLTTVYTTATGSGWQVAGSVKHPAAATSVASGTAGQLVLATTAGIYESSDSGKTWRQANLGGAGPAGGFSYVGMTNANQGVAVPTDSALDEVYVSTDGGLHWQPRPIAG